VVCILPLLRRELGIQTLPVVLDGLPGEPAHQDVLGEHAVLPDDVQAAVLVRPVDHPRVFGTRRRDDLGEVALMVQGADLSELTVEGAGRGFYAPTSGRAELTRIGYPEQVFA
jgi:hypothetical protein